jgi:hypothetical protein
MSVSVRFPWVEGVTRAIMASNGGGILFGGHNPHDISALVEQRSPRIAKLNRSRNLSAALAARRR